MGTFITTITEPVEVKANEDYTASFYFKFTNKKQRELVYELIKNQCHAIIDKYEKDKAYYLELTVCR